MIAWIFSYNIYYSRKERIDMIEKVKIIYKYISEFFTGIKNTCIYGTYQPRHFIIDEKKKVVYLEMPKVANTSIKASILECQNKGYGVVKIHVLANENMVCKLNAKQRKNFVFTFVRNPFERIVSCYEGKYHKDRRELGTEREHLWFDFYLFGYIKEDRGFENFVRRIYRIPDRLKDFHFLPQYNILYDKAGKCMVDYVEKVENINEKYPYLQERYGLGELPHLNQSDKKQWMDYYTEDTARMVYQMYKRDIKAFGYRKEYKRLLKYIKEKVG